MVSNPGRGNCLKNTGLSGHMQMRLRHRIQGTDCTRWVEIISEGAHLFLFPVSDIFTVYL